MLLFGSPLFFLTAATIFRCHRTDQNSILLPLAQGRMENMYQKAKKWQHHLRKTDGTVIAKTEK
jgi:hypothetical protein